MTGAGAVAPPRTEGRIPVGDDRVIGYAEYGPADGAPLVTFHGMPGSRYQRHPDPTILTDRGVRQIAVERPGYGASTPVADRHLTDWPGTVTAIADHLGLADIAIAGFSTGGPHALACGAAIPDRITAIAVVSGVGPAHAPDAPDVLGVRRRIAARLAALPVLPRLALWPERRRVDRDIEAAIDRLAARLGDPDRETLTDPQVRAVLRADLRTAFARGSDGMLGDLKILAAAWGFDLAAVPVPVAVWHGARDPVAPVALAGYTAASLPAATTHIDPDAGHLLVFDRWPEILAALELP